MILISIGQVHILTLVNNQDCTLLSTKMLMNYISGNDVIDTFAMEIAACGKL